MRKGLFLIVILFISVASGFSLKEKIALGNPGDYVVIEQGGMSSLMLIRSVTLTHLVLEEIDVPSLHRKESKENWKEWVMQGAPGHTAWVTYVIHLETSKLEKCYSHSQRMWISFQDQMHFLPRLLSLPLKKMENPQLKRIGPPPATDEEDRRAIWYPSVVVEGQKLEKPSITVWSSQWPMDGSLIAGCKIEFYFSLPPFPVWIEIRSPHYKAMLRAVDSGEQMVSPQPLIS